MRNNAVAYMRVGQRLLAATRALLRRTGVDLVRYPWLPPNHVSNYLRLFAIDTVLDVGANKGQYALALRRAGYNGRIISFEPGREAFQILQQVATKDPQWRCYQLALGAQIGLRTLQIAAASEYSSFLPITETAVRADSFAQMHSEEEVEVVTIDSLWHDHVGLQSRVLLKLDTQGFEREILRGAMESLGQIVGVQLELTVSSTYVGQPTIEEMLPLLRGHGFQLFALYEGFRENDTGRLIELDGLFFRSF